MAVTAVDYVVGSMQQNIRLPEWLLGRLPIEAVGIGKYRLFIIVTCALLTIVLQWIFSRTRFGSRLRASVDDPRTAGGLGLDVNPASSSRPSRSARGSPGSAARSAPRCSGSTRHSRSSS